MKILAPARMKQPQTKQAMCVVGYSPEPHSARAARVAARGPVPDLRQQQLATFISKSVGPCLSQVLSLCWSCVSLPGEPVWGAMESPWLSSSTFFMSLFRAGRQHESFRILKGTDLCKTASPTKQSPPMDAKNHNTPAKHSVFVPCNSRFFH